VILRILRGRADRADVGRLLDAVRVDVEEWSAIDAAPTTYQPAVRQLDDESGEIEFLLVSTWRDAEAVLARGGEITLPRGRLAERGRLRHGHAGHYELIMSAQREGSAPGEIVRLSSIVLLPRRSSAFYEHVRGLWDQLVEDAGLVSLEVGRRAGSDDEQAVVVSVWESEAALNAATSGRFVGGDEIGTFYASDPRIEHFTALIAESKGAVRA